MKDVRHTEHRCYVDDAVEGSEGCVFDDGDPSGCDEAAGLDAQGLCKVDCPYWRHPEAVADSSERVTQQLQVKTLIRMDAAQARGGATQDDFKSAMDLAAGAPEFKGSFGHGAYYRRGLIVAGDNAHARHLRKTRAFALIAPPRSTGYSG